MPSRFDEAYSVDTKKNGFVVDMSPSTLLEQSQMNGFERTTKPVGDAITPEVAGQTTGGRGMSDTVAAISLGANGKKK
jgi:hypothetical protein